MRATFELDSAYREMRRGELMVQQIETAHPQTWEAHYAAQVRDLAFQFYRTANEAQRAAQYFRAAEYAVAVKDLMRAIDKLYNVAGP